MSLDFGIGLRLSSEQVRAHVESVTECSELLLGNASAIGDELWRRACGGVDQVFIGWAGEATAWGMGALVATAIAAIAGAGLHHGEGIECRRAIEADTTGGPAAVR